jgi:hypothetical protein
VELLCGQARTKQATAKPMFGAEKVLNKSIETPESLQRKLQRNVQRMPLPCSDNMKQKDTKHSKMHAIAFSSNTRMKELQSPSDSSCYASTKMHEEMGEVILRQ